MKLFHSIKATVFAKQEEDKEKIETRLKELFPFDFKKEKIKIEEEKVKGFEDKTILIISILIKKQNLMKKFTEFLFEQLNEVQKEQILEEINTRVDDESYFFIRIDKNSWIDKKKVFITEKGDCYHLKFKVASYPSKKSVSLKLLKKFIENQLS